MRLGYDSQQQALVGGPVDAKAAATSDEEEKDDVSTPLSLPSVPTAMMSDLLLAAWPG